MRTFELSTHVQAISRSDGRSATSAAAYRACCTIVCEREGRTHDYARKKGLEVSAIVLPDGAPDWAADRSKLWNAAELRERNRDKRGRSKLDKANAVVAREFMYSFPAELSAEGRLAVATALARHLADKHQVAADFSIHKPGRDGDERNYHCHMLTSTRRLDADGFGGKADEWRLKKSGTILAKEWRAFVADTLNRQLQLEGKQALVHVEHRSFVDRGSTQRPTRHNGVGRTNAERQKQRIARQAWERAARKDQQARHADEKASLRADQAFALAAKGKDLAYRARTGIAAIREALAQANAGDSGPTGLRAAFSKVAGRSAADAFNRAARADARAEQARQDIAALRESLKAERRAFVAEQAKEATALKHGHDADDRQMGRAADAKRAFDRTAEVEGRRQTVRSVERSAPAPPRAGPGSSPA